jgi:hypothetical protein
VLETVSGSRRGAALIGVQPDLVDRLIAFLDEQLPPIQ